MCDCANSDNGEVLHRIAELQQTVDIIASRNGGTDQVITVSSSLVTTVTDLRAVNTWPDVVYISDDGVEGWFKYNSNDSVSVDDGVMVIVTIAGKHYKRMGRSSYVNVSWFGAIGDGINDDRAAIQRAVDFAKYQISANGGNYRLAVKFNAGTYRINGSPINCTNINGIYLVGSEGRYVNVMINGNTGAQIFDMSGVGVGGCEGFTFISDHNETTPSTIGVQFALTQDDQGNQRSGLSCTIHNCYFQMDDNPTFNGGLGTIGLLNIRSEQFAGSDLMIRANSGIICSGQIDLTVLGLGSTFIASSQFCTLKTGTGSMGVIRFTGEMSVENYNRRRPAIQLYNANSFYYQGYLVSSGSIMGTNGTNVAIGLFGQNDNIHISGTIEGFSTISTFGLLATNIEYDFITANQSDSQQPVFNVTGAQIYSCRARIAFGNPSEYNNGRVFVYHAPIGGGELPATGQIFNSEFTCGKWVDNALFVSMNVLNRSINTVFNSGQQFEKLNKSVRDRKSYTKPLGTVITGHPDIYASLVRFKKADKSITTAGNGGIYKATIRGCVTLGILYTGGGNCTVDFESNILVSQTQAGVLNNQDSSTVIFNKSSTNAGYLDIVDVIASFDMTGDLGRVMLTVKNAGTGIGETCIFNGYVELMSDFLVNQSVIFD